MKFSVQAQRIQEAIGTVERVTGKQATLPVLKTIRIAVSDTTCTLRATNLSLGVEVSVQVTDSESGICAVEGGVLLKVINSLPKKEIVTFETQEQTLSLTTKHHALTLKTTPHDDFPTLPKPEGTSVDIPASVLVSGLRSVYYSCATSDIKPEIASVYVYAENGELVCVATDSFRLAEKKMKVKNLDDIPGMLIPFKNVIELIRLLDGQSKESVTLQGSATQLAITTSSLFITSRLIDGVFPDYQQIIPDDRKTEVTLLKQDFQDALKLSNIFSDKFNQITLEVTPDTDTLTVTSKNPDVGENTTDIQADGTGEAITANFNHIYLLDAFQSITTDSITLSFFGESKPMIMRGVSDQSFLYLVMPMNR